MPGSMLSTMGDSKVSKTRCHPRNASINGERYVWKMKIWVLKGDITKNLWDMKGQKSDTWQENKKSGTEEMRIGWLLRQCCKRRASPQVWMDRGSQRKRHEQRRGGRKRRHQSQREGRKGRTPKIMFYHRTREVEMLRIRDLNVWKRRGRSLLKLFFF